MNTIAYNTSKGAVINFTRTLGAEWGKYNITVNAICPGFFPSKMTAGLLASMGEERLAAAAPLQRLGDDEDLKGLCVLFASDAGKHITGQWLAVDGGGNVLIADTFNDRIRRVAASTGLITTVAGNGASGFSGDGGPATSAKLGAYLSGLAVDAGRDLFIADTINHCIRRVAAATGIITTVAGTGVLDGKLVIEP
jgi:hypothetical protein